MRRLFLLFLAIAFQHQTPTLAADENWSDVLAPIRQTIIDENQRIDPSRKVFTFLPVTLQADVQYTIAGLFGTAGGNRTFFLADFASQRDLTALQSQVVSESAALATLQDQTASLQQMVHQAIRYAWAGSALAAALPDVAPQDGKSNRLGMNIATANGATAIGIGYSRLQGPVDINAGVSFNTFGSSYALGRIGAGFSW